MGEGNAVVNQIVLNVELARAILAGSVPILVKVIFREQCIELDQASSFLHFRSLFVRNLFYRFLTLLAAFWLLGKLRFIEFLCIASTLLIGCHFIHPTGFAACSHRCQRLRIKGVDRDLFLPDHVSVFVDHWNDQRWLCHKFFDLSNGWLEGSPADHISRIWNLAFFKKLHRVGSIGSVNDPADSP